MNSLCNTLTYILLTIFVVMPLPAQDFSVQVMQPEKNYFVLVMDKSGSMYGERIKNARVGLKSFIADIKSPDEVAIVEFSGTVDVTIDFTANKNELYQAVNSIEVDGTTRLYDAIAKAASLLASKQGRKIVVYLTDGADTGSKFTLQNIKSMNLGEGIFIYGIGIGTMDHNRLKTVSAATGGMYENSSDPGSMGDLYQRVQKHYYSLSNRLLAANGSMTVLSLPGNQGVIIDGQTRGRTPLKLDGIKPGSYQVEVLFPKGSWDNEVTIKKGYRNIIRARETDLGYDVYVASNPMGASVFIDDEYVGLTARSLVTEKKTGGVFKKKMTKDFSGQLRIPIVAKGKHTIRIVAMPDFDFGSNQVMEFEFVVRDGERHVDVDIFNGKAVFNDGEKIVNTRDPFKELNMDF